MPCYSTGMSVYQYLTVCWASQLAVAISDQSDGPTGDLGSHGRRMPLLSGARSCRSCLPVSAGGRHGKGSQPGMLGTGTFGHLQKLGPRMQTLVGPGLNRDCLPAL